MTKKKGNPTAINLADAVRKLKKAVPPQDNPLLRHQSEQASRSDCEEKQNAELRIKVLEQLKQMPTNEVDTGDDPGERDKP